MVKVKACDLRKKRKDELLKNLDDFKTELAQLRVAKQTGGAASKLCKIKVVRKSIARVLTVLNQAEKHNLRKLYKGKKWKPYDLRKQMPKAERLALKPWEKGIKRRKLVIKMKTYPRRKFAVRV
eukprot:NODE_13472_length_475_cov_106.181818_g13179_i0.p1 GENE.NODE_13472_length_475_cov_106.181818_g13179_i0~~NODE_13472_length_475_cov_106.181818_g13179_i0.p1  ORF type:complete len:124 (+),score=33.66 NODE_13472_length_475_cov_106.181818_g13179_i0:50-421(+)